MHALRKTFLFLVMAMLVFTAVPSSAELIKQETTGFNAYWDEESAHHDLRVGTVNGRPFGVIFDLVHHGDDEEFPGWRWEHRVLTNLAVTVAPDLSTATVTGLLPDGTPISAVFDATGKAENMSPIHPAPWATAVDCDGVSVNIETGKFRDGQGSVTIGDTILAVTGQFFRTNSKVQDDQYKLNQRCSNVQPHGPKTPPDQH